MWRLFSVSSLSNPVSCTFIYFPSDSMNEFILKCFLQINYTVQYSSGCLSYITENIKTYSDYFYVEINL